MLARKRGLSIAMIRRLHEKLGIPDGVLIQPFQAPITDTQIDLDRAMARIDRIPDTLPMLVVGRDEDRRCSGVSKLRELITRTAHMTAWPIAARPFARALVRSWAELTQAPGRAVGRRAENRTAQSKRGRTLPDPTPPRQCPSTASSSSAPMLVILITGLTAGPAVSL